MSVMDKIRARTAELKDKKEIEIPSYISRINYQEYGIIENDLKIKLINCEKKAVHHVSEMAKNVMELSKVFSEAQNLLSDHNGGTFKVWFESLGFKKDFVYMCLKRNNLFLELDEEKVFLIPEKAIKTISKIKDKIDISEIKEIINSEKPTEMAKEKENGLSGNPTTEIEEAIIIEDSEDEIRKIEKKIAEYNRIIKELEYELSILKKN